jgi:hypothetical protein
LPTCRFTTWYYNYEIYENVEFNCQEEPLASGFCVFHDQDYLQDKTNNEEHKRKVLERLKHKVNHVISNNEPLFCIGFQLPDFSLSDLNISKDFAKSVYFSNAWFLGKANFFGAQFKGEARFDNVQFQKVANLYHAQFQNEATFSKAYFNEGANFNIAYFNEGAYFFGAYFEGEVSFIKAHFEGKADFSHSGFYSKTYFSSQFNGETQFHYVLFEGKEKVIFDMKSLSNVSFMNTDITGVRFSGKARWGGGRGEKAKEDRFKIIDERLLEKEIKEKQAHSTKDFNLGSIKAVYRNLRENYEYRMRYDEAGQFFIREMELKRKYREAVSSKDDGFEVKVKQNNRLRRNFSLTGLYYNLFVYGGP